MTKKDKIMAFSYVLMGGKFFLPHPLFPHLSNYFSTANSFGLYQRLECPLWALSRESLPTLLLLFNIENGHYAERCFSKLFYRNQKVTTREKGSDAGAHKSLVSCVKHSLDVRRSNEF